MSLLAHAIVAGYLVSVPTGLWALLSLLDLAGSSLVVSGALAAVTVALWWSCRRGEDFIAKCCIRQYIIDKKNA